MRLGRPGTADRGITVAFVLAALAAVAFGAAYVAGGGIRWQGVTLALALAFLAIGFATWAARQLPEEEYVEERHPVRSPTADRAAVATELARDDAPLAAASAPRRALFAALGALSLVLLFPLRSLFRGPRPGPALARTGWRDGTPLVLADGGRVRPDDLAVGSVVTVFPPGDQEAGDAPVILVRMDPDDLDLPEDRRDWAVDGMVAFSKICTHAGCPVGEYLTETERLMCPCHQSVFDVRRGAQPEAGPAARPLPQLPLGLADAGHLVARGPLSGPVGPGYWRRP